MSKQNALCDEEMIEAFCRGEELYLEVLFQKYIPYVRSQIRLYRFSGWDREDLLQESRIVMYQAMMTFDCCKKVCFFTYFNRLLKNRFARIVRHCSAQKRYGEKICASYDELDMDHYISGPQTYALNPLDVLMVKESFEQSYDTLTKGEKHAIYQKYYLNDDTCIKPHHLYRGESKMKKAIRCR